MFGLGMPEVLLLMAIALMVIGPKKLPDLAKTLGRAMGEFKKAAQDFKQSIDMEDAVKKFEEPAKSVRETINEINDPLGTKKSADPQKDSQPDQRSPADTGQITPETSATDQDKNRENQEGEKTSQHMENARDGADK